MAAQSTPIPLNAASSGVVYSGMCTFRGFWLTTSAGALVTIYDGITAAGTVLAQFTTAAAAADREWDTSDGVRCTTGIYVQVGAGTVTGNVRIG